MHFDPELLEVLAKALDQLARGSARQSADDLLIDLADASPIARNVLLDAGVDHLHDIPAQEREAFLGDLEGALLSLYGFRQVFELLGACDDRRQIEAIGLLHLPSPALARIALAVWAVAANDQPAVDQDGQMAAQRGWRHAIGAGHQLLV